MSSKTKDTVSATAPPSRNKQRLFTVRPDLDTWLRERAKRNRRQISKELEVILEEAMAEESAMRQ